MGLAHRRSTKEWHSIIHNTSPRELMSLCPVLSFRIQMLDGNCMQGVPFRVRCQDGYFMHTACRCVDCTRCRLEEGKVSLSPLQDTTFGRSLSFLSQKGVKCDVSYFIISQGPSAFESILSWRAPHFSVVRCMSVCRVSVCRRRKRKERRSPDRFRLLFSRSSRTWTWTWHCCT